MNLLQSEEMKPKGTSIIFLNGRNEILLLLRDDFPHLKYPGCWDIPGGGVEEGETPEQTIAREMQEEMGLDIAPFSLFTVTEFDDRTEYTYWKRVDFEVEQINLMEGQRIAWFSLDEAKNMEVAFGGNVIIEAFIGKLISLNL